MKAIATAPSRPAGTARAGGPPLAAPRPLGRRGSDLGYIILGTVVPAALYLVLGYEMVLRAIGSFQAGWGRGWVSVVGGPVGQSLYAAFCLIPVGLFVVRLRPQVSDRRILPRLVAFLGTTILLLCGNRLPASLQLFTIPPWAAAACTVATTLAMAGAVWGLLTLRRSFGIFPAARRLVTTGPYRLVRHPLYLCEITAALAAVLPVGQLNPLLLFAVFCGLQLARIGYEERLLRNSFPDWAVWARGRARLIPGVW